MTEASDRVVVGIDGGATRTRYLLADGSATILARSEGRGSLVGAGEDGPLGDAMVERVRSLAAGVGATLPLDALCAGLAGAAGRVEARRMLETRLRGAGVARRVSIVSDADVAFLDAFGEGGGILLIAGTGSVALGRSADPGTGDGGATAPSDLPDGVPDLARVGGWGSLLGDEGSGYGIGLEALRAAIRGREGRGPATALADRLFGAIGTDTVEGLLAWSHGPDKSKIAALAPAVIEEAERGDATAEEVVAGAVLALVAHVRALAERIGVRPRVALVGGLIEPGGPLRSRMTAALSANGFEALPEAIDPARGAVRMALAGR